MTATCVCEVVRAAQRIYSFEMWIAKCIHPDATCHKDSNSKVPFQDLLRGTQVKKIAHVAKETFV